MTSSFALVTFPDEERATAAFAIARDLPAVIGAAVATRDERGRILVARGSQPPERRTMAGGLLGALIGALGGPLGTLLGSTTGSLLGQNADLADYDDAVDAIAVLSDEIPPGTSALLVEIPDDHWTTLHAELEQFDARIMRILADQVAADVALLRDQIDEAATTAHHRHRTTPRTPEDHLAQ